MVYYFMNPLTQPILMRRISRSCVQLNIKNWSHYLQFVSRKFTPLSEIRPFMTPKNADPFSHDFINNFFGLFGANENGDIISAPHVYDVEIVTFWPVFKVHTYSIVEVFGQLQSHFRPRRGPWEAFTMFTLLNVFLEGFVVSAVTHLSVLEEAD